MRRRLVGSEMCIRDRKTVDEGKLPVEKLPQVYARKRIFDLVLVGLFTDLIVRFFSSRNILLLMARLPLMFLLARLSLLRQLLLKAMTDGPITVIRLLPE